MAVGRISGPLLKSNLVRNGIDLAFETDLLYLDVNNGRIGINTASPQYDLDVNGTIRASNILATTTTVGNLKFAGNSITSTTGTIDLGTADSVVYQNKLTVDGLEINDNTIRTIESNANIELDANGTGTIELLTDTNINGDLYVSGNIRTDGNITIGDSNTDNITINAEIASDIIPDADDTYTLGSTSKRWNNVWVNRINAGRINTDELEVDGIDLSLTTPNVYYVAENGSDGNIGNHRQAPFLTIEYALTQVTAGDTIHVMPGVYQEVFPLVIPAGVTLRGHSMRSTIIQPNSLNYQDAIHLNGEVTVEDLTIRDFYYDSGNDVGYAFRFAPNFEVTTRSPYIRNVSVITKGSVTSASDPRGFDEGDAGKGAYLDGSVATADSKEAACLFHAATFITPGVDAIVMTNGVRVEWLNSFTYYANRGLYGLNGSTGLKGAGQTAIRVDDVTGSFSAGETFSLKSVDGSTTLGSGTIASKDSDGKFYINGLAAGIEEATTRTKKTLGFKGGAELDTGNKKFGASSLLLDGVDSYLQLSANDDFGFEQNDFTIEFWVYPAGNIATQTLVDMRAGIATDNPPHIFLDGTTVKYAVGGTTRISGGTISVNTWHHIAVSRFNGWTRLYLDGTQIGTTYRDLNDYGETKPMKFGADYAIDNFLTGAFDDIHVATFARYQTGSYTVPTSQVVPETGTVFLTHLDGADGATELTEDVRIAQTIEFSGGATANFIDLVDRTDFGAEIRTIGSANVYGNYGAYGDGNGVLMYLVGHNFAYIGNGKADDNDETTVVQTQEVTELNSARIRYTSVDQGGDFRVGDKFFVDQETGQVVFNASALDIVTPNGITFESGDNTTFIDGTKIETGNFRISGNTIETISGDFNVESATGEVNIQDNTYITGDLDVTGDVTIGGNITIGDEDTDSIEFGAEIDSNLVPNYDATYDLGTTTKTWRTVYSQNWTNGDIDIQGNTIRTTQTNSDLELQAAGTGSISVPASDVTISDALTVEGQTTLEDSVTINAPLTVNSTLTQTSGTFTLQSSLTVSDALTVEGAAQFENIQIAGNAIRTTETNSDLELDSAGTGKVIVPDADLEVGGDITVLGTAQYANVSASGTITTGTMETDTATINGQAQFENILINDNFITTTQSNSDLELRASGTGRIYIPDNDVTLSNDFTVSGSTTLNTATANSITTTSLDVDYITINGTATFDDIEIAGNVIQTTLSNSDLELRASGTGDVIVPENNVVIENDLTVEGDTSLQNVTATDVTVDDLVINENVTVNGQINLEDIEINDNIITTTQSNSDLELRANGTGEVIIPDNNVVVENDLTVNGNLNLATSNADTLTSDTVDVAETLTVTGTAQFEDVAISGNRVFTTLTNSNLELGASGTGVIDIPNNDVVVEQNVTIEGDLVVNTLDTTGKITANSFSTGDILIDDNFITTTQSNSNLELRANGTGGIVIDDLTFANSTITSTGDFTIEASKIVLSGNDSLTLPSGTTGERNGTPVQGMIRYNTTTGHFEGYNGAWITLTDGLRDDDGDTYITAELTQGADDDVIRFYNAGALTADLTSDRLSVEKLIVDDIEFNDNTIRTVTTNSDLILQSNGTGGVLLDEIKFTGSTITSTTTDQVFTFDSTGTGYWKFAGTRGVVLPVGDNGNRPNTVDSEAGMIRYNTEDERTEIFDGTNWTSVAGSSSGISRNDAEAIALEFVLILG